MVTHGEISDLLAAYALDAVVGDEYRVVEGHLEQCPRCWSELDAFRDVAAGLGNSVVPLPDGVWLSIERRLRRVESETQAVPGLIPDRDQDPANPAVVRRRSRRISTRAGFAGVGSILGAAAAAAALFGFGLVGTHDDVSRLQAVPNSQPTNVVAALEMPGHTVVNLSRGSARTLAQFVLADGRGYLVSSSLPALRSSETYQLWGVVNGQPISLGLLGESPSGSVFTLAGSSALSQLRITAEPSGGSVVPSGAFAASGLV